MNKNNDTEKCKQIIDILRIANIFLANVALVTLGG